MIQCKILLEEVPRRGVQIAIIPEADKETESEAKIWGLFDALFRTLLPFFQREFGGPESSLVSGEGIMELVEERIANLSKLKNNRKFERPTVHYMQAGQTYCGMPGVPRDWPVDHFWESDWQYVTCEQCIQVQLQREKQTRGRG